MKIPTLPGMSSLESAFFLKWKSIDGYPMEREFKFHKLRNWRFDFAHPDSRVAVELEGGIWKSGRHTNGLGFEQDCEKYNAATMGGWAVVRLTGKLITYDTLIAIKWMIEGRASGAPHIPALTLKTKGKQS